MLDSVIYLKSIILAGYVLNLVIPLTGIIYKYYEDMQADGFINLTTEDLGAIKAASGNSLLEQDVQVEIAGGDYPLTQY